MRQIYFFAIIFLLITEIQKVRGTDNETQNLHRYIWANYNQSGGNLDEAKKWYNAIFSTTKISNHTYQGYLDFLKDSSSYQKIVHLLPKIETKTNLSDNPSTQLIIIQALEQVGRQEEAMNRLIQANNKHKGHPELAFFTANLYLRRNEPKNALIVINDFLSNGANRPNNFIFYFLKGQILVQLNQIDQALKQLKQCLEMHPNFEKGWLFYATLEEKKGTLDNAIKGYLTYLELIGGNKEVERHIIQLLLKQNMIKKQSKNITIDSTALKQVIILFEQKRYHDGLKYLQEHINKKTDSGKAHNNHRTKFITNEYKKTLKCVENKMNKMLNDDAIITIPSTCLYHNV